MLKRLIPVATLVLALSGSGVVASAEQGKSGQHKAKHASHVQKDKQKDKSKGKSATRGTPNRTGDWTDEQRARYAPVLGGMTLEQAAAGFPNHGQAVAALNASREHNVSFVQLKHLMVNERLSLGEALRRLR